MHRLTRIAALLAAVLMLAACCILSGCDDEVIVREPIEGPPPTQAPTETIAPTETPEPTPTPVPSFTLPPTLAPTPEPTAVELKEGTTSPEVRALQERLAELGYLDLGDQPFTDYYGPATRAAVERFQSQNGFDPDGIVGTGTLAAIQADNAPHAQDPTPAPEQQQQPGSGVLSGITIGLDPGHQARGNNEHEPIAPGSSQTKPKVSSGTAGVSTGVSEYIVNLSVGLRLRDILEGYGANVIMTRDTNDVNISNAERATMMNNAGADLVVRLHCDGEDDSSLHGAFILVPVGQYVSDDVERVSRNAAETVLEAFVQTTGAKNRGISERDDQTGFNWSTVPVINIEMGHMSNPDEDQRLASDDYQQLCAEGIAQGLLNYFS